METQTPSSSPSSPSPQSNGAFWSSRWGQRLWWLISALSGTLEIEAEGKRQQQQHELRMKALQQDNEKLDVMILQVKKETELLKKENEQSRKEDEWLRKENERLFVLKSKIDGSFSKYNINLKAHQTPEQP